MIWPFRPRRRPRVRVVSKSDCPLCDELLETLARLAGRHPHELEVVKIEDDPELAARHALEVPVVFVDGEKRFFGKVDERLLARRLTIAARSPGDAGPDEPSTEGRS